MLDTWNIYAKRETMLRVMSLDWIFVEQKCIECFANGDEIGVVEDKDNSLVHPVGRIWVSTWNRSNWHSA